MSGPIWPDDFTTRWGRRAIRFAAALVPSGLSRERRMEWEAELWQLCTDKASPRQVVSFVLGVYWDAGWGWVVGWTSGSALQDVRYAFRMLARSPGFTFAASATLALSIGASTALFSVVDQAVLADPPYPDPDRLVVVDMLFGLPGSEPQPSQWSYPRFLALQEDVNAVQGLAGYSSRTMTLTELGDPSIVPVEVATPSLFPLLGVSAERGRVFGSDEEDDGSAKLVAVVSRSFWTNQMGATPDAVGQTLTLDQLPFRVIGILPSDFDGVTGEAQVWIPFAALREVVEPSLLEDAWNQHFRVLGRLEAGATVERARSEVESFAATLMERFPPPVGASRIEVSGNVVSYRDARENPAVKTSMAVLFIAVSLVLLIATANLTGLLLARGAARQREAAVRVSLGASRARLMRQLLTESLVLSLIGGAVGVGLAWVGVDALGVWLTDALGTGGSRGLEYLDPAALSINWRVFCFALFLTGGVGVGFGLMPAWQSARTDPNQWLKGGSGIGGRHRTKWGISGRDALVAGQIALALVLLTGASLLLRTTSNLRSLDLGFDKEGLLTAMYTIAGSDAVASADPASFHLEVLENIRALPGVTAASLGEVPMGGPTWRTIVLGSEGLPELTPAEHTWIRIQPVADGHLNMMGATLLEGRDIQTTDEWDTEKVIVLSRSTVAELFPGGSPLGQRLQLGWSGYGGTGATVVGVVEDIRLGALGAEAERQGFVSIRQSPRPETGVLIRAAGDPEDLIPAVRSSLASIAPNVVLTSAQSMDARAWRATLRPRMLTMLLSFFGAVALLLVAVGLYGTIAFGVTRRIGELGLRASLGAGRGSLAALVLRQGIGATFVGIGLGISVSLWATRFLESLLFGTAAVDPTSLLSVSAVLLVVAAAAAYVPARRGMRVDPMVALRDS
jgi:putative ABC transport system permease protein